MKSGKVILGPHLKDRYQNQSLLYGKPLPMRTICKFGRHQKRIREIPCRQNNTHADTHINTRVITMPVPSEART